MTSPSYPNFYRVYGLNVASEIEIPSLIPSSVILSKNDTRIDVWIRRGLVPESITSIAPPNAWAEVAKNRCVLRFPSVGNFLIERGDTITVQKHDETDEGDVQVFLLGSALATIAHQRGLVPLHVSAILSPGGVIAFTGASGAGKSSMAAHLHREFGWPLVSDDVSVIYNSEGDYQLESGVRTVKLWKDTLASLNRTSEGLKRDLTRFDKFHAIEPDNFVDGRFALKRLILLEWGDELRLYDLKGRRSFQAILQSVHRPEIAALTGNRDNVVRLAMDLSSKIQVQSLVRDRSKSVGGGILDSIRCVGL